MIFNILAAIIYQAVILSRKSFALFSLSIATREEGKGKWDERGKCQNRASLCGALALSRMERRSGYHLSWCRISLRLNRGLGGGTSAG